MPKFSKDIVLSIAPYKTVRFAVSECDSFDECDKELRKELDRHPDVKKLNAEDIEKVLG